MLRSLASYFFGGASEESHQVPVLCRTREINDWLLVDMTDEETCDVKETDVNVSMLEEAMDETEDDNVSHEVPSQLVASDWTENVDWPQLIASGFYESSIDNSQYHIDSLFEEYNEVINEATLKRVPLDSSTSTSNSSGLEDALSEFRAVCESLRAIQDLENMARHAENGLRQLNSNIVNTDNQLTPILEADSRQQQKQQRQITIREVVRPHHLTCQLLYSNNYVNHRSPSTLPKAELQERIKELEAEQKAKIFSLAKDNTRSSMYRHNKNYIYQSSAKTNRRKNLQRNHSGANNNRKC